MEISIIIPTFNGAHKILNILKALDNQTIKNFEVIIVIDGSQDNTKEVLESTLFEFQSFKIIDQKNVGRSCARNNGVKVAKGEIIIFFDDDMRPTPECVAMHIKHHQSNVNTILVGSVIEDYNYISTDIQKFKAHYSRIWEKALTKNNGRLDKTNLFLTAANFSISKKTFFDLGSFDENLSDAEDFDLGVRAILTGIPIYFNPTVLAWHDDLITCKSLIKRQIQYRRAHDYLKILKPSLYQDFNNHQIEKLNPFKKIFFYFFSFSFWPYCIDNFNWLLVFPKFIRYKFYNYIITSQSLYYPIKI